VVPRPPAASSLHEAETRVRVVFAHLASRAEHLLLVVAKSIVREVT